MKFSRLYRHLYTDQHLDGRYFSSVWIPYQLKNSDQVQTEQCYRDLSSNSDDATAMCPGVQEFKIGGGFVWEGHTLFHLSITVTLDNHGHL